MKVPAALLSFLIVVLGALPLHAETIRLDEMKVEALSSLPPLHGPALTSEVLEGKVVAVTFFASWCPPCHAEFENLKQAKAIFGKRLEVVAVNIFERFGNFDDPARLARFLDRHDAPFVVLGDGEAVAPLFGDVRRIPTLFVFAADGRPELYFVHARGAEKTHVSLVELEEAIRAAL